MPESKNPSQAFKCTYCGEANLVPITPLALDFEGNNSSTRLNSQRSRGKVLTFTCKWCKRKNTIDK